MRLFFFVCFFFFLINVIFDLKTKKFGKKGVTKLYFDLKENPVGYWISVSFEIGLALFSLIIFLLLLLGEI